MTWALDFHPPGPVIINFKVVFSTLNSGWSHPSPLLKNNDTISTEDLYTVTHEDLVHDLLLNWGNRWNFRVISTTAGPQSHKTSSREADSMPLSQRTLFFSQSFHWCKSWLGIASDNTSNITVCGFMFCSVILLINFSIKKCTILGASPSFYVLCSMIISKL